MADVELKQAIAKRNTFKNGLIRLNRLVDENPINDEIPMRASRMLELFVEFDAVQTNIEFLDDSQTQVDERFNIEDMYYQLMTKVKKLTTSMIAPSTSQTPRLVSQSPKLPEISLPTFHGGYDKWTQFRDTFLALVHENGALQDIQKLYYLQSCLKGEAAQVLESLPITENSYSIAWDALFKRYNRARILISSHLKGVHELPAIQRESYSALRSFLDIVNSHLKCLDKLADAAHLWEHLIVYILTLKLDNKTRRDWENSIHYNNLETPTIKDILTFIEGKCQILEGLSEKPSVKNNNKQSFITNTFKPTCRFCNSQHTIYKCSSFLELTPSQRVNEIIKLKFCLNCLKSGHFVNQCKSHPCTKCNKRHNTLLHVDIIEQQPQTSTSEVQSTMAAHSSNANCIALLSTALIDMLDINNKVVRCRALLDSGSQSNFMTKRLFNKLKLKGSNVNITIKGITQSASNILTTVKAEIKSTHLSYSEILDFLIHDKISDNIPQQTFKRDALNIPNNIILADPAFNVSKEIDILLGTSIFYDLLCVGQIKLGVGQPTLQKTKLGWIVAGPLNYVNNVNIVNTFLATENIQDQLEQFWQLEGCNSKRKLTADELDCENTFVNSLSRKESGHFVVDLPLQKHYRSLGDSLSHAQKRFNSLENKLGSNPNLKSDYASFMKEYEELGHMTQIKSPNLNDLNYYIPHHCVLKESSSTTLLRVVFDASAKSSSGLALNDVLKVGPTIQNDIFCNVTRFRIHDYVVTGDIEKMYRQVYINNNQRDLQRIIWRSTKDDEIKHYQLNTVTYGTASASFLATRALKQISIENAIEFPSESKIIAEDFYVDDLLTGSNNLDALKQVKQNLVQILASYGFNLRKFITNFELYSSDSVKQIMSCNLENNKTLGISWNANQDIFLYDMQYNISTERVTKRIILSMIAHVFDPLGLLGPVIIQAKVLIQDLWKLKLDWDESVPMNIHSSFNNFKEQLKLAKAIKIPRQVTIKNWKTIEIHGFCDASQVAYGACVYICSMDERNHTRSQLLCAKSRVAPLKIVSLPRLELCGALLLAQLLKKVPEALQQFSVKDTFYWSDSKITLAWINSSSSTLKTFVANRVTEIQESTNKNHWKHVPSINNPADIISRGLNPNKLADCKLWWEGPQFLQMNRENWPSQENTTISDIPETRILTNSFVNIVDSSLFDRFSSLVRLQSVVAHCFRFYNNLKIPKTSRATGSLTTIELNNALIALVKIAQTQCFPHEVALLTQAKSISRKSKIYSLNPFMDTNGLIRVGGRLSYSNLPFEQKHPIILPEKHTLTRLIIRSEHLKNLHAGSQLLLSTIRQKYWPINGRMSIRSVLRNCVTCFRANPSRHHPLMGSLPEARVNPTFPFHTCGIDFAGPFLVKEGTLRSRKFVKAYICLFVCFTTKAVHLELTSSLSTNSFLNCLKRFVSRRGLCKNIYTDNATNFVGANNEIIHFKNIHNDPSLSNYIKENSINWNFIPARSPHFGGLWEAAVKSCKFHLKRILINMKLTFENFYTVLTQVEAVLNSRPLLPMTNDPSDLQTLTPWHFLIGRPLNAIPEESVQGINPNRLDKFQQVQRIVQDFWSIWSKQYLHNLQQRTKWKDNSPAPLDVGTLVLMVKDNTPPLQWPLGRITELHPGKDNIVRVVSVKTTNGIVKRAVANVCPLQVERDL